MDDFRYVLSTEPTFAENLGYAFIVFFFFLKFFIEITSKNVKKMTFLIVGNKFR